MSTDFNSDRVLQDVVLEFSTVSGRGEDEVRRAAKSDGAIAEIANTRGIPVSADKIRLIRFALGVFAFPRGGARQGAGRKLGNGAGRSYSKGHSEKSGKRHIVSVSDSALVTVFASSIYEHIPAVYDGFCHYSQREKYVVKREFRDELARRTDLPLSHTVPLMEVRNYNTDRKEHDGLNDYSDCNPGNKQRGKSSINDSRAYSGIQGQ